MIAPAAAAIAVALATQAQAPNVEKLQALAENEDTAALHSAIRDRPADAREALRILLERAAGDSVDSGAARFVAFAYRLARGYAEIWRDSFPVKQVARFAAWSPQQRSSKVQVDSLRRAGNAALGRSGFATAARDWRESYRRAAALEDTAGMAAALGNLGAGFYRADEPESAVVYLERARSLAETVGDRRTAVNALGTLGSVSKDRGDLQQAQKVYARALAIRREIGDVRGEAADRNNLGLLAELRGDLEEARALYREALAVSRSHDLAEPAAVSLINLGNVATVEGDYAAADESYRAALALYRGIGSDADAAFTLRSLGLLGLRRGNYPAARQMLAEAVAIYARTGPAQEEITARKDLADALAAMGDLQGALTQLRGAEAIVTRGPPEPVVLARLSLSRADLAVQFNRYVDAERDYGRAEYLYRQAGDGAGQAEAVQGEGLLSLLREDYAIAEARLALALRAQDRLGDARPAALTRLFLGFAQRQRGDTAAARHTLHAALDSLRSLGDPVAEATALGELGDLDLDAGTTATADSLYRRALVRLGLRTAHGVSWQLHAGLARALARRGDLAPAVQELQAAVTDVERVAFALPSEQRRGAYLEDKWDTYAQLAQVEFARGDVTAAFEVSERLRARQMLDLLARGRVPSAPGPDDSLTQREQDLRRHIDRLTMRLDEDGTPAGGLRGPDVADSAPGVMATREALARAQDEYGRLLQDIQESRPAYGQLVGGTIAQWREVAALLAQDQALLEYLVGDSTSLVFVVTRDSLTATDLKVGRRALARRVEFVRSTMTRPTPGGSGSDTTWRAPLRRLYADLVAPIERDGRLAGVRRLIVVAHAELHYLPFAALIRQGTRDEFLIERYELTYTPSASVWVRLGERRRSPEPRGVLALAPRSDALPGSRAEVEAIRTAYGSRATVLQGPSATEDAFRRAAASQEILHIASYGVLNKRNPLFSYVDLRRGGSEDGRLEVHEVFGLDLRARLVVLSACQTGVSAGALSDVPAGDDWVGFAQSFLTAGAGGVLATLWPVEDRTTAQLMRRFYQRFGEGGQEAAALAEAQRLVLRESRTAHPFYWAPFELVAGR